MAITLKVNRVALAGHGESRLRVQFIEGSYGVDGEWRHTHEQAISYIEKRLFVYYLHHETRAVPLVIGRTPTGDKFLKAETDGDVPALLLNLSANRSDSP